MISEDQQEQAALYALGMLGLDEAGQFEQWLAADAELRALTRELRDAAAAVALDAEPAEPPSRLRSELLRRVAAEAAPPRNVITPARWNWAPWTVAAALAVCCAILAGREGALRRELAGWRETAQNAPGPKAGLQQISFCELEPPAAEKPQPRAAVAWDAVRREGVLRWSHLKPAGEGKDYQLWVVEDGVKKPVNAGVIHVAGDGTAEAPFKPLGPEAQPAVAFALSLERAGGVPESEGPILLVGKLPPGAP